MDRCLEKLYIMLPDGVVGTTRSGNNAKIDFRLPKLGRFAGNDHVTRHRKFTTTPQREAGNSSDHNFFDIAKTIPLINEGPTFITTN